MVGAILGILSAILFDAYVLDGEVALWRVIVVTIVGAVLGVVIFKMGTIIAEILNTEPSSREEDHEQ